jgi:Tol biopolymer transport system component
MRRPVVLFIALSLLASACGTLEISLETPPPAIAQVPVDSIPGMTAEPVLSMDSSSDEIRNAMLKSANQWNTIWMDGLVTWYPADGSDSLPQVYHEQVWIEHSTPRFRTLLGLDEGKADQFTASDGISILRMDLKTGRSESTSLPTFAKEAPADSTPHMLWGQIGTPISEIALSSNYASDQGVYEPTGMEIIAERETLIVEWTRTGTELPQWRLWLDTETGVILKLQEFGKGGGEDVLGERVVNQVIYDEAFADALFQAPSSLPQFSDVTGSPLTTNEPAPTTSSDPDPLRDVYFFVSDHTSADEKIQLMRVPGSCAAGLIPCPEAQAISTPFGLNFSLTKLVWSPDGDAAAFAYPINENGNRSALFVFEPETQNWQSLVEFNFIDPPYWSPDGNWLAFRVQDGQGGDEIYAIRRDGSRLTNLSMSENLPSDAAPSALSGWINNHVVLHSRSNGTIYLFRVEDSAVTPLFDTPLAKSDLIVPSPDGYFLAYTDASEQKITLKLLTPDGRTVRDLATFQNSSIYPIVWSPDGSRLAFVALANGNGPIGGQNVYIIDSDGRGLQQVYQSPSASIAEIIFSPDGNYLLFQDDDAAGRHIFIVDLASLQQRILQVPNLPLDWWWLAPSWR